MTASTIAGRYSRDAEIGRGGMGAVWRSTDQVLGRRVALKRIGIAPDGATPDALRAEREARLAASLNDPHVVSIFDLVADGDEQWLVMEYVEGTDLAELIRTRGALAPDDVAPVMAQVASALAAAHGSGIVHRDVKPSNILVTPAGGVRLSDFGIARTQADAALTQTGLVTGSPAYLSPEVASGQLATPASDVWSLGATIYHALEGHPPYDVSDNVIGGLYRIVHEAPPRPAAPGWLEPLLLGTMTHDPADRWTAAQAQTFLEAGPGAATQLFAPALAAVPATAPADGSSDGPDRRRSTHRDQSRVSRAWWVIAVAAVLLVAVGGWAVAVGFGDSPDRGTTSAGPTPGTRGPSTSAPPSQTGSATPTATPSADEMTTFLKDYLQTVVSNRGAAFAMLTPGYQQRSGELAGYSRFWRSVSKTTLLSATADPATLTVDYTYRYVRDHKLSAPEEHRMQLEYDDGRLLIDDQT